MKREDLDFIAKLLGKIRPQDAQVAKALSFVQRDLAIYDARRGQLLEEQEYFFWGDR